MKKKSICAILLCEDDLMWLIKCIEKINLFHEIIISNTGDNHLLKDEVVKIFPLANVRYFEDQELDPRKKYLKYQEISVSDYIMLLHPDEILSTSLVEEIMININDNNCYDAFAIRPFNENFGINFGKSEKHTIRIYRKGTLNFDRFNNVHSETFISGSEIQIVNGLKVKLLSGDYTHYSNPYFLIYNYKIFRYEMINAQNKTNEELDKELYKFRKLSLLRMAILSIKIAWRFFRNVKYTRKYGYGGIALSFGSILTLMAEIIASYEEKLFRQGKIDFNDTRGYIRFSRYSSTKPK